MSRIPILVASSLCLVGLARADDRFVNPTRPGAFPTIQAAHDAANPGDRIVIEVDLPWTGFTNISKSLTIESADSEKKVLPYLGNATQPGTFLISGLTPPLPLVLRSLAFRFYRGQGSSRDTVGIRTQAHYDAAMHLDNVSIDNGDQDVDLPVTLMDVDLSLLCLHYSRMVCKDSLPIPGVAPLGENTGSDCLVARVRELVIEDSEIWAGSAPFVRYIEGFYQAPFGGRGGIALYAPTDATVVVRSILSDGNGGSVETGPWTMTPVPGAKGVTLWMGTNSFFQGWNGTYGPGLDGQVVAARDPIRDVQVFIDRPEAPLHIGGNALISGALQVDVNLTTTDPCVVLFGTKWTFLPVPGLGILWVDPGTIFLIQPVAPISSILLPVPNDPRLIGLPVIGQPILLPTGQLLNPSSMLIR